MSSSRPYWTPEGQVVSHERHCRAAVEVQLRLRGGHRAFQHFLDEVDAAARAVEFVAKKLVGRTGGRAETAMHALAQDGVGFPAFRRVLDEGGEVGLHYVREA